MKRLLLVAPPFPGHLFPLIDIGKHLRRRGHEIAFATGSEWTPLLRRLDFETYGLLPGNPAALKAVADTQVKVGSNPLRLARQLSANLDVLPAASADLRRAVRAFRPDALLADFTAPVAGPIAAAAGIGWLTTMPTPFAIETRTGTPSYCGGWSPPEGPLGRVRDAAGRATIRAFKLAVSAAFAPRMRPLGLAAYRQDGTEGAYSPTAILGLGLSELEFDRDWPAALQLVGPVTAAPEARRVPSFLDADATRVLVSVGTHLPWVKRILVERVLALARLRRGVEFVVTMGRPDGDAERVERIAPNVLLSDFLAYDEVLHRFAAVIHHGGAGVSYSTLRAGLPALVWPQDYDQFDFAARLVHAGVGLRVRQLGARSAGALDEVLAGLDRAASARLQAAVRASDPCGAVDSAIRRALA